MASILYQSQNQEQSDLAVHCEHIPFLLEMSVLKVSVYKILAQLL